MSLLETTICYTVEEEEEEEETSVKEGRKQEEYDTDEDFAAGDESDDEGRSAGDENTSYPSSSNSPYGPLEEVKWQSGFQKKYSVMHDLGKGRFSVVKRCQRVRDKREVASKFVRRGRQEQRLTEIEFLLLRSLRHPAFVRPYALYTATAKFDILIMEMVMGLPLLDWIFTREETTEAECALLLVQVVEALQYLHTHHIAYLDLKPENLLIDILRTSDKGDMLEDSRSITQPAIRLIDLGSARYLEVPSECSDTNLYVTSSSSHPTAATNSSTINSHIVNLRVPYDFPPIVLGSPEFMAPEIIARNSVGVQADYWSLGVLIYVLISGRSPFLGTSPESTCKNITSGNVRYPVEHFNSVTQEACDLIHDLLLQNPDERPHLHDVLAHPWFNMVECESVLPVHSLADFCFRRNKVISSTQEFNSSSPSSVPSGAAAAASSSGRT